MCLGGQQEEDNWRDPIPKASLEVKRTLRNGINGGRFLKLER